jgi:hypothetical protein
MGVKFQVELGGRKRVAQLNVGVAMGFERLAQKPLLGEFNANSLTDLVHFYFAALKPENPTVTLAEVQGWIEERMEGDDFVRLQMTIVKATCEWRKAKIPAWQAAMIPAALRAELGIELPAEEPEAAPVPFENAQPSAAGPQG